MATSRKKGQHRRGPTPRKAPPRTAQASSKPAAKPARPGKPRARRPASPRAQDQLFFTRMRTHARWVFVLLALTFAVGFVVFGVGSGQGGLGSILGQGSLFHSSGPSLSSLEAKARKSPKSVAAWQSLASAYQGHGKQLQAIAALKHVVNLSPKDAAALQQLAGLYQQRNASARQQLQQLSGAQPVTSDPFLSQGPLGQTLSQDPLSQALQSSRQQTMAPLEKRYQSSGQNAIDSYKLLLLATPKDPNVHLELASMAAELGQYDVALSAARRYLKLAPDSPQVPQVKNFIKQVLAAKKSQAQAQQPTSSSAAGSGAQTSQPVKVAPKPKK